MKTSALSIAPALLLFFALGYLNAQVVEDPITNIYKVGGSSEIFIGYSTAGNTFTKQGVLDIPETMNDIIDVEDAAQFKYMDLRKTASAVGDFNFDGIDDVVTVRDNTSGGITISIPIIGEDLEMGSEKSFKVEALDSRNYSRLRLCVGDFDGDKEDEFAVCFGLPSETINILIFETDTNLEIELLCEYHGIAYYDHNIDISSGDMEGDGVDELVLVKNKAMPYELNSGVNPPKFVSNYDLYIFKYDRELKCLNEFAEGKNLIIDNQQVNGWDWYGGVVICEMRIACGDLNIDGKDEIVVAWSNYYSHYTYTSWFTRYYHFCDALFLNTFRLISETKEIKNEQNMFLDIMSHGGIGFDQSRHIGLSLKCEKLDNRGRDEVLLNSSTNFFVLGSTGIGMELEVKEKRAGTKGNLNIQGSETFVVADLNPDTATLNFDKEVILLLSNQPVNNQLANTADVPSFEMLMLDTVSADTVAFLAPESLHDFPFEDNDINTSSFLAGDFDLKNTDVYMIGTPTVISVTDLEYPLVILNAPPVHFDVINGVSHDLCDAFVNDDDPAFSALYNTRVNEQNTTSVEVNNSMGFSSDFSAYAMAGGSGFESSVKQNWDMGKSFYRANSHNTMIEEEKEVYTEDFVLYSCIDYSYYKYPIYNEAQEIIGNIAVLNPESDNFKSVWGSGNSWNHPGYIFNHEPGNILSYKPFKNVGDICFADPVFSAHEFSRVPVTNTGNGSFNFTFENITDQGNSYSFSGGTGMDFFTKVGFEGNVTVNVGAFGIGGSIGTDVRVGVSCDLSSHFCSSKLSNHSTQLTDAFQIDGKIGRLKETYDNVARYYITPYIYRSQSGALVLDYMVDLDENNMEWWTDNYGQEIDLAFILPWRYAVEKGSEHIKQSKIQKTSEIQFYPPIVSPGDTVCITSRVHNYSLLTFDNTLKLNYYLGDPENGGVELTDVYGVKGSEKPSTMIYGASEANLDFEEFLIFNWQVPDTLTCSPRIYAVIDEDGEYDEIHEDNNTGWNSLNIYNCDACSYMDNYIDIENFVADLYEFEIYPNPARSKSILRFSLPSAEKVTFEVYDISGTKVASPRDEYYTSGEHEIEVAINDMVDGIYFYRFTAGLYSRTLKVVVMH